MVPAKPEPCRWKSGEEEDETGLTGLTGWIGDGQYPSPNGQDSISPANVFFYPANPLHPV